MSEQKSLLRETDAQALNQARTLMRGARYGTLAVFDPETGFPNASRVLLATTPDGVPAILVSALSSHTKALRADPRCSLLTGEPGKGDPLAHPRLSLQATARPVPRDSALHQALRRRFLARHPKAALYIDFGDFGFFTLDPERAGLNGGFGKAYEIKGIDLRIQSPLVQCFAENEAEILDAISTESKELADEIARIAFRQTAKGWKICAIDAGGIDLGMKDLLFRLEACLEDVSHARITSDIRKVACSIP